MQNHFFSKKVEENPSPPADDTGPTRVRTGKIRDIRALRKVCADAQNRTALGKGRRGLPTSPLD
jgi:hypothetical protein